MKKAKREWGRFKGCGGRMCVFFFLIKKIKVRVGKVRKKEKKRKGEWSLVEWWEKKVREK